MKKYNSECVLCKEDLPHSHEMDHEQRIKQLEVQLETWTNTLEHLSCSVSNNARNNVEYAKKFVNKMEELDSWKKEVDNSIHRLEQDYHRNTRDWSQTVSERASKDKSFVDCLRDELKYEIIREFLKETIEMSTKDINMLESNKQLKAFQKEDLKMNYRVRHASQELLEYVGEDDE